MQTASDPVARRWSSTNLVGLPPGLLGSTAYNAHPQPLRIAGTRETHPGLFSLLERCGEPAPAREVFMHYLTIAFGLDETEPRRFRASAVKLLQGWALDASSGAGAVLKGWAESRFGLVPVFHGEPLGRFPSPGWVRYLEQKHASRFHNNNIQQQLDLLYEFCQWTLERFQPLDPGPVLRLWRGSSHAAEQVIAGSLRERRCTVRLNNVVSFSLDRDQAACFGDWVFETWVPAPKLLVVPGLLPTRVLDGEGEVIALGGDYEVIASYA
ncbi:MAG: NAD(+)--dinitrogen-reductase ADP-D-ribosyltransferase [Rubrivivax sp.]